MSVQGKIDSALNWMRKTAADQSHGYSQQSRWGSDYDCSSAVITAWQQAGVPVKDRGATYTGNMLDVFLHSGFTDVTKSVNLVTCAGMKPGDVLLNVIHHTAMYNGGGKIVHARGQSYGSPKTGDQGAEFAITSYYNYPWDYVLRYTKDQGSDIVVPTGRVGDCSVKLGMFVLDAVDPEIKTIQILLNAKGYKGKDGKILDVDGELGENTAFAITNFQKAVGMKSISFGTVAKNTWIKLIG